MSDLLEQLKADCEFAFDILKQQMLAGDHFVKAPPAIWLEFSASEAFNAEVAMVGFDDECRVQLNDGVLSALFEHLDEHRHRLFAISHLNTDDELQQQRLLEQCYNFALYFVLLHELYHVLGGHLKYIEAKGRGNRLAESQVSQAQQHYDINQLLAFYFELEADAHAVITLTNDMCFADVAALVSGQSDDNAPCLMELKGEQRIEAFKLLLASVWMLIVLLEAQQKTSDDHPLPASRLLAITSTIMSWFCEMDGIEVSADGAMTQEVSTEMLSRIDTFLFQVAKPVLVNFWNFPDSQTAQRMGFTDGVTEPGLWIEELRDLMLDRTPARFGQPLVEVEKQRRQFMQELAAFRCFETTLTV